MNIKKIAAYSILTYFFAILLALILGALPENWHPFRDTAKYPRHLPDFSQHENAKEKKAAFFAYLSPIIDEANQRIKSERELFTTIKNRIEKSKRLSARDNRQLASLIKKYKIVKANELEKQLSTLDLRINTVPKSLILSQAANESAWGTSRFAVEANNLFGQWCFQKGCGLIPNNRSASAKHEVRRFATVYDSVAAYLRNINTHRAYRHMRKLRLQLDRQGIVFSGYQLAGELENYSERREEYIREIRQMIRANNLE